MIKNGKVEAGKTPSEFSGKKSELVKRGVAVRKDEKPPKIERDLNIPMDDK